jgi:hypothetical protein
MGETGPVEVDSTSRFQWKLIFEFQWILEFGRTLRISTWRFRRKLDMGIFFLNSPRLLKEYRKIQYASSCNAS